MSASPSAATARAVAFVAARRESAEQLGGRLADFVGDPEALATQLRRGMETLADPDYLPGVQAVAPGIGAVLGVRWPLNAAVARGFRTATRRDSPAQLLFVADRLFRERPLEIRWFAFGLLERLLPAEPERSWQLLRRAAREAADWITIDSLAHPYGRGILLEPYRWAELEQLVFSPSRWERRLVGSTLATMPFVDRRTGRTPDVAERGLRLVADLIGDDEPDVQKALAWALRSLALVDQPAVEAFCRRETALAAQTGDGRRAWVIRDTLAKLTPATADELRGQLAGIRRRAGTGSTSRASEIAGRFDSVHLGGQIDEPPLT
jgi:3-methyladenine DNA glycosylase AlkD